MMNPILDAIYRLPRAELNLFDRSVFIENLRVVHAIIVASEPLIEETLKHPLSDDLRNYYTGHLSEERSHAEWLREDLASAGATPAPVNWWAAQIAGLQYYLIRHVSPEVLLGYMAALECRPMPMEKVEALEASHGKALCRSLRYHAKHDMEHGAALLTFIDSQPDLNLELILDNAVHTTLLLNVALRQCAEDKTEATNGLI